ncbi:thiosulfate oxidation carrier protein SoxY [Magnetococcales bacterium HHB-1]
MSMPSSLNRRQLLLMGSLLVFAGILPDHSQASRRAARQLIAQLTGQKKPTKGGISIELPPVTDQADFVPVRVRIETLMQGDDFVKSIHLAAEGNPEPHLASFHFSKGCSRAEVRTKIRLVKSQMIIAAAVFADGRVKIAKKRGKISTGPGGCG